MQEQTWHQRNKEYLNSYMKTYRKNNPEYVKKQKRRAKPQRLMLRYGITQEEYDLKLKSQKGCCAICFKPMVIPQVDHNHVSNKVRELLCRNCNRALGMFLESVEILNSAIRYIQKHTQN